MRRSRATTGFLRLMAGTAALACLAGSGAAIAQGYAPPSAVESYYDEYGREIFLDAYGRVVGVAQPERAAQRAQYQAPPTGQVFDRPPPPGVTLEGPAYVAPPQGGAPYPNSQRQTYPDQVRSGDPLNSDTGFETGSIESEPLPGAPGAGTGPNGEYRGGLPPAPGLQDPNFAAPDGGSGSFDQPFREQTIIESDPAPQVATPDGRDKRASIAALQVILDRAGISPGVIDGRMGSNVNKAVAAYEEKYGRKLSTGDSRALAEELDMTGGPAVITYELTADDVAGPYVASIPSDYAEKAKLAEMSFERPSEKLAEKFHMDEEYLKAINPNADFSRAGTQIKVMNVGQNVSDEVDHIIADKGREQVRAYNAAGELIAAYPSTIGSSSTPSPTGTVHVNRIAFDPNYTYNPKINFKQGENDKVLTIPPGPNGPVGSIWIALSKPTYGIHGTPDPSKIGKTNSHGCVRLTNWDAYELAKMVKSGVTVEFVE